MGSWTSKFVAVIVALVVCISSCWYWHTTRDRETMRFEEPTLPNVSSTMVPFTIEFTEPEYVPNSPSYNLPLSDGELVNLCELLDLMNLTTEQMDFLYANGILGLAHPERSDVKFTTAFEWIIQEAEMPVFITSDSVLDTYHLLFARTMQILEEDLLYEQARYLSKRMMILSHEQRDELPDGHRSLAEDNVVFFGTALTLLDREEAVPTYAKQAVGDLVSRITSAEGDGTPPGFEHKEDYTQYKPRGHYTNSQRLSDYFRAMMWYGRMTFRGQSVHETRRAVLASMALTGDEAATSAYIRLTSIIGFMVGAPDDLTCFEYADVARQNFIGIGDDLGALFDDSSLETFQGIMRDLRPPRICSDIAETIDEYWGLRFVGQAFVWDSYVFQNCVYPQVVDRFMPSCLDVMAALGSEEAWDRESFDGFDTSFEVNLGSVREELSLLDELDWNQSLYTAWLHSLQALHPDTTGEGFPPFMRTEAWRAKELNTQSASWTQLTHDTLLYRKQSAEFVSGVPYIPIPNITYVEPVPELYSRIADMVDATIVGLHRLSLAPQIAIEALSLFKDHLEVLERVAVQQLVGEQPSEEDMNACRYFYRVTEWKSLVWTKDDCLDIRVNSRTVLVSDVHTVHWAQSAQSACLQEGVGHVRFLLVVIPHDLGPVICMGPVFEHYEFTRPLAEGRLTDEEWELMLQDGTAPDPAPWARDFIP